ncbi:CpaF family protein [Sinanaerobacter chloroacetimidivorans]|jgi:pilus assembly protein CpaF|uniref:CpaF family protein n=1 Tax=Sinanaerobacter chloroacetimidivorans TaxID=2818044 RepID=A0A8J8AZC1_9FIRM|nr:CpaF family protein [Sinanaerobacter chloroacetimidivorans]MBR0596363.1 CpaF family protein [Sinanaerobacter chloroacetimidivorans]
MKGEFSTIKEITDGVRAVINNKKEQLSDCEVLALIEDFVLHDNRTDLYSYKVKGEVINSIFNSTRKDLDLLQPYAEDKEISEIMVNGTESIFVERHGHMEKLDICFETAEELEEIIRRIAAKVHREINELNPIVDARLDDGSRVNAVYKNIALNGPILTIRRFPEQRITMKELLQKETLTLEAAEFLKKLVSSGYNIFISGGTSSGKTTFLNVLSEFIPKDERVIVIEDSAELQISGIDNIVRMECKNANVQGKGEVNVRQLIKTSLRMRPNRIIIGEVRGGEVLDMIQAMNTGHDGSLSTGHGNSPEGMLSRMESMFLQAADFPLDAIRSQIAEAIDIIVHLGRLPDKSRKVLEITEIEGYVDGKIILNPLYKYKINSKKEDGTSFGILMPTGNRLQNTIKLELKGAAM